MGEGLARWPARGAPARTVRRNLPTAHTSERPARRVLRNRSAEKGYNERLGRFEKQEGK